MEAVPFPLRVDLRQRCGVDPLDDGDRGNDGLRDAIEFALLIGLEDDVVDRGVVPAAFVLHKEIERRLHEVTRPHARDAGHLIIDRGQQTAHMSVIHIDGDAVVVGGFVCPADARAVNSCRRQSSEKTS
jgi:hypothetical protein